MTTRRLSVDVQQDMGASSVDYEDDRYDDDCECWNCGGEGFVYGCSWDWQCDTWDGDSCLCTRRCDVCQPRKPDPALQAVLTEALAADAPNLQHPSTNPPIPGDQT